MLGPFATASRRIPPALHCHSPGVATAARRHGRTPPAHRCPQQQRQHVTEGTAMAPWNEPNHIITAPLLVQSGGQKTANFCAVLMQASMMKTQQNVLIIV